MPCPPSLLEIKVDAVVVSGGAGCSRGSERVRGSGEARLVVKSVLLCFCEKSEEEREERRVVVYGWARKKKNGKRREGGSVVFKFEYKQEGVLLDIYPLLSRKRPGRGKTEEV
jgi:hypothetical protein